MFCSPVIFCCSERKKTPKESKITFPEPIEEDQFDADDPVFTVEGKNGSKRPIPMSGSSFRPRGTAPSRYVIQPITY